MSWKRSVSATMNAIIRDGCAVAVVARTVRRPLLLPPPLTRASSSGRNSAVPIHYYLSVVAAAIQRFRPDFALSLSLEAAMAC